MAYHFPEQFASMTIQLHLASEATAYPDADTYLADKSYALAADFVAAGLTGPQVEEAVNEERIRAAAWPLSEAVTHFFWAETEKARETLGTLAAQAVEFCYGRDEAGPIGGNFASVGASMGSQQLALAGLIYAREQGTLREIGGLESPAGPLYIVRNSFSGQIFETLIPEQPA